MKFISQSFLALALACGVNSLTFSLGKLNGCVHPTSLGSITYLSFGALSAEAWKKSCTENLFELDGFSLKHNGKYIDVLPTNMTNGNYAGLLLRQVQNKPNMQFMITGDNRLCEAGRMQVKRCVHSYGGHVLLLPDPKLNFQGATPVPVMINAPAKAN